MILKGAVQPQMNTDCGFIVSIAVFLESALASFRVFSGQPRAEIRKPRSEGNPKAETRIRQFALQFQSPV